MATPDVRVRLTAEGVAEVVAALKRIQSESAKTTAAQGGIAAKFADFRNTLRGVQAAVAAVGLGVAVASFTNFIKRTSDAAEQLDRMRQLAALSAADVSVLSLQADRSGVSIETLSRATGRFIRGVQDGSPDVVQGLKAIGLSFENLRGKEVGEQLDIVSRRFAEIPESGARTNAFLEIFGERAGQLLPLFNDLGKKGFAVAREEAEQLGLVLEGNLVAAADQVGDDLGDIGKQIQTISVRIVGNLGPAVSTALDVVKRNLGENAKAWDTYGKFVGQVVAALILALEHVTDISLTLLEKAKATAIAIGIITDLIVKGQFEAVSFAVTQTNKAFDQIDEEFERRQKRRIDAARNITSGRFIEPTPATPAGEDVDVRDQRQAQARLAAARAAAENELKITQARIAAQEAEEKRLVDQSIVSLETYYARRRALQKQAFEAEIKQLEERRKAELQDPDVERGRRAASTTDAEIAKLRIARSEDNRKTAFEEQEAIAKNEQIQVEALQRIREARGQDHLNVLEQIRIEAEALERSLRLSGVSETGARTQRDNFTETLTRRAEFEERARRASVEMERLEEQRATIQQQINAGLLSEAEGQKRLVELDKERLPELKRIAAELLTAAEATGNPELIAQAQSFKVALGEIEAAVEASSNVIARVGVTAEDAFAGELADAFDTAGDSAENFLDRVLNVAGGVVAAVRRMLSEIIATGIVSFLAGLFRGIDPSTGAARGAGAFGPGFADGGRVQRRAVGGRILRRAAGGSIAGAGHRAAPSGSAIEIHGSAAPMPAPRLRRVPLWQRLAGGGRTLERVQASAVDSREVLEDENQDTLRMRRIQRRAQGGLIEDLSSSVVARHGRTEHARTKKEVSSQVAELNLERERIQQQVTSGRISRLQGDERIAELDVAYARIQRKAEGGLVQDTEASTTTSRHTRSVQTEQLAALDLERQRVETEVATGRITDTQASEQLLEIDRRRVQIQRRAQGGLIEDLALQHFEATRAYEQTRLAEEISSEIAAVNVQRRRVQQQVTAGTISEFEGNQKIAELDETFLRVQRRAEGGLILEEDQATVASEVRRVAQSRRAAFETEVDLAELALERRRLDQDLRAGVITEFQRQEEISNARRQIIQRRAQGGLILEVANATSQQSLGREFHRATTSETFEVAAEVAALNLARRRIQERTVRGEISEQDAREEILSLDVSRAKSIRQAQGRETFASLSHDVDATLRELEASRERIERQTAVELITESDRRDQLLELNRSRTTLSGIQRRASGGLIKGPGTGTSDGIAGELPVDSFVMKAAAVRRPGVLGWLQSLVRGRDRSVAGVPRETSQVPVLVSDGEFWVGPEVTRDPVVLRALQDVNLGHSLTMAVKPFHLAGGGLVASALGGTGGAGGAGGAGGPGASGSFTARVELDLAEGLTTRTIERTFEGQQGDKLILRALQRNPKAARAALGRG